MTCIFNIDETESIPNASYLTKYSMGTLDI